MIANSPMGRAAKPEDIRDGSVSLFADGKLCYRGVFVVDGGQTARRAGQFTAASLHAEVEIVFRDTYKEMPRTGTLTPLA